MATVTKPIALDESLNTTELSSRNVADVLAQELSAVATAIGGIAVPSADHVSYDNSVSGLSATDVQNALDEIVSDIPTVNNGTLTIQQNGTSKGTFTANSASNVNVNIETPTADKKTATDQFNTANGGLLSKCMIDLVPVQSGSGDPSPDNVRPISGHTEVDLLRCGKNIAVPYSYSYSIVSYANDIVTVSGTTADTINRPLSSQAVNDGYMQKLTAGTYIPSFEITPPSGISLVVIKEDGTFLSSGNAFTITEDTNAFLRVQVTAGTYNYTSGIMLEKSNQATSYEPYLGHLYQVQIGSTVYGGYVDLVSGVMTVDREFYTTTWGQGLSAIVLGNNTRKVLPGLTSIPINSDADSNIAPYLRSYSSDTPHFYVETNRQIYFILPNNTSDDTVIQICTYLATPLTIQLPPQQIETLAGQNNLSTPLSGQSIETNGVEYKELFTFADVKEYVDKKIPDAPTTDGTYTLQAVVSGGVPTYSWV